MPLRLLSCLMLAAAVACSGAASAQTARWPERPIRLIVPFQPGSSSDTVARIVATRLGERLGQQIIVDNRVGASGNVGAEAVARAAPDGYTLGLANTSTHAVASSLAGTLGYDPVKDFAPISMIGSSPFVLAVYSGLSARDVPALVALAKAKPRTLRYASAGPASIAHLAGALFEKLAGVELVHVPYRGSAQSVIDLVEGRIEIQFGTVPPTLQQIKAGRMRVLAVTGERRDPALPEVPTVAETGISGYEASLWQAFVAPAGTPSAIVDRLNRETRAVLEEPQIVAAFAVQGVEPQSSTPEELAQRIRSDIVKWRDVIAGAGITAQ
jgi:tripartite-type tricarboxylate transporter receptor subunit TctC